MRNTIVMNETGLVSAKSCRHGAKIASRFREISFVIDNNNNRHFSQLDESKGGTRVINNLQRNNRIRKTKRNFQQSMRERKILT